MSNLHRCQLPVPLPEDEDLRLVLRIMRRMATHGLRDAQATLMAIDGFGKDFRRPLVLLRAFIAELAQASRRRITVAPSCALRMTADESRLVGALATASHEPDRSRAHLRLLTDRPDVCHPLSAALAIASALGDLGRPLPRLPQAQRTPL